MAKAYLGLGSNMGDKKNYIDEALRLLENHKSIVIAKTSSYYETDPHGYVDQDIFLNIVVEIDTTLEPYELLALCNEVEANLDRKRIIRWGPRTIDLDILLYDEYQSNDEKLTIPHPTMVERNFVMVPLYEINQELRIDGKSIKDIIEGLTQVGIRRID